ncbi:hypothetical protein [uncultured Polaribacter sp.]|uniref:Mom family adenine methylcarbamoylation protein n=1 Tax=uncultured Polaribacter sp. TaxID=174711 RepID=UPI00259B3A0D|nr:hypothetical protein [uncultured Polaribacter sp.]
MGRAKEIIVKVINSKVANAFVKKHHYSGKVVNMSNLHFGCFLDNQLHGVMSYGSPMDKRNVLPLVDSGENDINKRWNEMLELNRMAFDDYLPKYSESRCIAISIRMIKKNAPQIKWILSYSDATQCGDGTIYRASGFKLTQINKNGTIYQLANGEIVAKRGDSKYDFNGAKALEGFQNRYILLIDKSCKIVPEILDFKMIDELGAGMYKGEKITLQERRET